MKYFVEELLPRRRGKLSQHGRDISNLPGSQSRCMNNVHEDALDSLIDAKKTGPRTSGKRVKRPWFLSPLSS